MREAEKVLQAAGGLLIAVAAVDGAVNRRVQPWHGLGVLCVAVGRGLQAMRELGWTE